MSPRTVRPLRVVHIEPPPDPFVAALNRETRAVGRVISAIPEPSLAYLVITCIVAAAFGLGLFLGFKIAGG